MNLIVNKENERSQLDLLLAQRRLYSDAKKFFTLRTASSTLLAIIGPLTTLLIPVFANSIALISVVYLLLDHLLLQYLENSKKKLAAKIQELFDTIVLDLPWNSLVCGSKPAMEEIARTIKNSSNEEYAPLINWYSEDVGKVSIENGRFLCQRSNLYWDSSLRNKYVVLLFTCLFLFVGILVAIAYALALTVSQFIAGVVFPCLPLFELLIKQIQEHVETKTSTNELITELDVQITKLCTGEYAADLRDRARAFQDEVFRHRKGCPMVFDWLYWKLRSKQEAEMQFSITRKIAECSQM